jgi:hypothetical protein
MNKGPSITIDLFLIIIVLWVVIRGQGKSWIDTLFRYHPVNLDLNPLPAIGSAIGNIPGQVGSAIGNIPGQVGSAIGNVGQQIGEQGIGNVGPQIPAPMPPGTKPNPLPSVEIGGWQPTLDGVVNAITGARLDRSRPIFGIGPLAGQSSQPATTGGGQ